MRIRVSHFFFVVKRRTGLKYPKKPKLSAEVKDLIESLMEPDPNNRATLDEVRDHPWLLGEKL